MKHLLQFNRFMVMLVAMLTLSLTQMFAAETKSYEELFTVKSDDVVTASGYTKYETTVAQRNWIITFGGNNKSVGTNSTNRSKCNLGSYTKYAVSPVTSSNVASAFVSTTSIADVAKISYTFNGGSSQINTAVYLIYSADGTTFSQVELTSGTQGATLTSGTAYEFAKCSGYFGLLFKATNTTGNWRIDDVNITFYKEVVPVTLSAGANGAIAAYSDAERTTLLEPKDNVVKVNPNSTVYFTATPAADYEVDTWTGATADAQDNTKASLAVGTEAASVSVTFKAAVAGYNVTLTQPAEGTISASKTAGLAENDEVTLSYSNVTTGYQFNSWSVIKDGTEETVAVTDNKFKMPASNVTASATFAPIVVTEVQLKSATSIEVGASETLVATVLPEDALVQTLTWATADDKIATVDQSGKVTAVAAGTVNITATSTNGKVGTCAVTVTEHVVTPGAYDITPNNVFFNCDPFTTKPKDFTNATGSQNDITVKYIAASNAYINASQCRMYSGTKMDFSVPEGYHLKAIKFTADGSNWAGTHTCDKGAMTDSKNWSGSTNKVTITFGGTCRCTSIKVTYAAVVKSLVSKDADIQNGDVSASTTAGAITFGTTEVEEGTIVTLSSNPATGYKLIEYSVYKTGDTETTVDVEDDAFTMPAFAVTVSATFESAKVLTSVEITTPASKTEFWKGEEFTAEGLVLTAHFDGAEDAVVEPDSIVGYNMSVAGQQTVKVYFTEGATTKYAEYTINVKTIANTKETAYSVDSAIKLVVAGKDLATKVYVKGVITSISGQNNNNVFVKDAGLTNSFEFYNLADGSTYKVEDLTISDTIIGYGEMTYYAKSGIYEFKAGCTLEDRKEYIEIPCAIENTLETAYTVAQAIALIDQGECLESAQVYVKGVVTSISGSTTKDIVICDAGQSNSFKFYQIVDGDATVADVQLYDTIAAKGYLIKYQSTYELDANCTLEQIKAFVPHVLSVSLNSKAETIAANGSVQLSATVLPEDAPDKSVTWSVIEGATLVSVEDGLVSGLNAGEGTATVRVTTTDGGFTDDCVITITAAETRKTASITGFTATEGALNPSDITYKGEQGGASTKAAIYNNGLRLYQNGGYVTIAAAKGCKIDEVIITTNATYSTTAAIATTRVKPTSGVSVAASSEKSFGTGMNADTAFVFCLGTTSSSRLELASIVVKYTGEAASIDTIQVSGEFQTEFDKGADFNHNGAVVTAYYSDESTAVVTSKATFSEPDMNQVGDQTVTVSYGGKQTSYTITVKPAVLDTLVLSGEYQTIFQVNEVFNHTGMIVTAVYSDESEVVVTDDATFSTPDMSLAGNQDVTVSYGGKATAYTIKVKAQSGTMANENVDFTDVYASVTSGSKEVKGYSGASFEMTCVTAAGSASTKYYANGNAVRAYTGNKIIIDAVDSIVFVYVKWAEGYADNAMTIKANTDGKSDTLIFSQNCRFTEIKVYYKYDETIRSGLSVDQVGTGCQVKNILAVRGGAFYNVDHGTSQEITFKEISLPIAAGTPAVFRAESDKIEVIYGEDEATETSVDDGKGLVGLISGANVEIPAGNIMVYGGQLRIVGNNCWLTPGHVYIKTEDLPAAPSSAPGRRFVMYNVNTPTELMHINANINENGKFVQDGQFIIIRDGKVFNAQGQIVR